jgi:hypothetical protein
MTPIFYVFANILGGRQYFMILLDSAAANICVYFQGLCRTTTAIAHLSIAEGSSF